MIRAVERDSDGKPVRIVLGSDLASTLAWQIGVATLPAPVREFRFAPPRRWRFDLCWPDRLLAVEVNGAEFTSGRHSRGLGMAKDFEKLNEAQLQGWTCLQFTGRQVKDGSALTTIERALSDR